jgi:diguanylate cyclase (GGDEF)-like protein
MVVDSFRVLKELLRETSLLTGNEFFQTATRILGRLLNADFVFIAYVKESGSGEMEVFGSWKGGKDLGVWSFQLPGTPCELIYENQNNDWDTLKVGRSVCLNEMLRDRFTSARDTNYAVFVGVPMRNASQHLVGHIALFYEKPWDSPLHQESVVELVELFSYKVQSELNRYFLEKERTSTLRELEKVNQILEQETITDPLTHAYNRRYFSRRMQEIYCQSWEVVSRYALLIIDIDHFKFINDQYGHDIGDRVLSHFSTIMMKNCRTDVELLFRIGGEEFAVLSRGIDQPSSLQRFGERINQAFRTTPIEEISNKALTVSIGGAFPVLGDTSWDSLYKRADSALYLAKGSGRDRTVIDERK